MIAGSRRAGATAPTRRALILSALFLVALGFLWLVEARRGFSIPPPHYAKAAAFGGAGSAVRLSPQGVTVDEFSRSLHSAVAKVSPSPLEVVAAAGSNFVHLALDPWMTVFLSFAPDGERVGTITVAVDPELVDSSRAELVGRLSMVTHSVRPEWDLGDHREMVSHLLERLVLPDGRSVPVSLFVDGMKCEVYRTNVAGMIFVISID